jgi:exodeoxyribonuclease VII small subunit
MSEKERPGFEEALQKLEAIVNQLDNPEITLEESIKLYEEGLKLSIFCTEMLDQAVLRIEQINQKAEGQTEE